MKKQFTTLLMIVSVMFSYSVLVEQAHADTNVSGIINTDTTWTLTNSPYVITDTVQIPLDITLTIEQGVIIKINPEKKIKVAGTLNANGSENLPIKFTSNSSNKWWGIEFIDSNNSQISNSIIENATMAIDLQGVSIVSFTGNLFKHNDWVITDTNSYQNMQFLNNTFSNNDEVFYGIRTLGDNNRFENNIFVDNNNVFSHGYYFGYTIVINNNFSDNNFIIKAPENGYGYGNIEISNNWWGIVNESAIDSYIEDGNDDVSLQILNYNPIKSFEIANIGSSIIDIPTSTICISWTYSDWSACQSNNTQSRTIVSSSPNDCSGGNPVLTQSCEYTPPTCTSWTYSDWDICINGQQIRTITSSQPANCAGGNPVLNQSCAVQSAICSSWTYSNWGRCENGRQTRTIASSSPPNCINGNPVLSQSCQNETNETDEDETENQETSTTIFGGDIIQCQNSSNPSAVYIVKIVDGIKYIRHIINLDIFNYYKHLKWGNLKQVNSLDDYSLSGWVRYNTGPNGTAGPTDKVYEINGDQTKHWINMTAEDFLTHGGSEPAIFNINQGELNLYTAGADVMSL